MPRQVYKATHREWKELRLGSAASVEHGLQVRYNGQHYLVKESVFGYQVLSLTNNPNAVKFVDTLEDDGCGTSCYAADVDVPEKFLRAVEKLFLATEKFKKEQELEFAVLRFESIHNEK